MQATDHDIDGFVQASLAEAEAGDRLVVPGWERARWTVLFAHTVAFDLGPGDPVIMPNAAERAVYFVCSGRVEIASASVRDGSLSALASVTAGSVLGELAFIDGGPRTARAWAVAPTRLLRLSFEGYERFAQANAAEASALVFAFARLLAFRLRRLTARL